MISLISKGTEETKQMNIRWGGRETQTIKQSLNYRGQSEG